jgi:hypothetical protein
MPRYGFYLTNGQSCSDAGGLDLPDDEAARIEADLTACDLRDIPGEDWSEWTIEVRDERWRSVITLSVGLHEKQVSALVSRNRTIS